jgi:death-on-curing family protein
MGATRPFEMKGFCIPQSRWRRRPSADNTSTRFRTRWRQRTCFHLVSNHPFVDGNKRTGLAAALMFLKLNQVKYDFPDKQAVEDLVLAVASRAGGEGGRGEVLP